MKEKNYLFNLVSELLEHNQEYRDSDRLLCSALWQREMNQLIGSATFTDFLYAYKSGKLSLESSIKRYRRILQDKYPASEKKQKERQEMVAQVKEDIKKIKVKDLSNGKQLSLTDYI